MKTLKKFMVFVIALVMILPLTAVTVNAETKYTITIKKANSDKAAHTYQAYQIFTGTLDATGQKLTNIQWGSGIDSTKKGQLASEINSLTGGSLTDSSSADDFASAITNLNTNDDDEKAQKIAVAIGKALSGSASGEGTVGVNGISATISGLPAGYYLIKDKDASLNNVEDGAYTRFILKVVSNVELKEKAELPTFEKKIKDTNDTTGTTTEWQDSADYDIEDNVPFELVGTVPSNYRDFDHYYFAFHDVEETGLTFNAGSVKVYVGDTLINSSNYEVKSSGLSDGCTFEVIFKDLKNVSGVTADSKIRVEYTSKLNQNAKLGNEGNLNKAQLEFSNNPNNTGNGTAKPSDTGYTPWDNVIVFTYQVVVNKYANSVAESNKLSGAAFTLSKKLKGGSTTDIAVVKSTDGCTFTFKGLDDGEYVLKETTTPSGYNTISPIEFAVNADHSVTWNGQNRENVLTSLTSTSGQVTGDKATGNLTSNVINKSGSTLPSTGGIGTRIFYIIGGLLMVAAAILLITKIRFHKNK